VLCCLPERSDELKGLAVPDLVVGPEHEAQELEGGAGVRGVRPRIPELFNIRPRGVGVLGYAWFKAGLRIRIQSGQWIRIRDSGSGSRRAKITHKSRKKLKISCFEVLDGLF
jgi:hypothetical protein